MPLRRPVFRMAVLELSLLSWACAKDGRPVPATTPCPVAWTAQVSSDSLVTLCTPPGFRPALTHVNGSYTWKRPAPAAADSDWIAVAIVGDSTRHPTWPPPLESPSDCVTDCYTVDSAVGHGDMLGSVSARLETGLVTGGDERARRAPRLVGGWITPRRTRVLLVGAAQQAVTLDTIRTALRTLRVLIP